ncbi:MAG: hypothetical protein WCT32_00845 [Patescibacteria group bacterium]|jgi:hypothetical protein
MSENQGGLTPDDIKRAFQSGPLGMPESVAGGANDDDRRFGAVANIDAGQDRNTTTDNNEEIPPVGPLGMPDDVIGGPGDDEVPASVTAPDLNNDEAGKASPEATVEPPVRQPVSPDVAQDRTPDGERHDQQGESEEAKRTREEVERRKAEEDRKQKELELKRKAVERSLDDKFKKHQEVINKEIENRGPLARFWQFYQRNHMARTVSGVLTVGMAAIPGGRLLANGVRLMTSFLGGATAVDAGWMKRQEAALTVDFGDCKDKDGNWDARKVSAKMKEMPKEKVVEVYARLEAISTAKGLKIDSSLLRKEQEDYKKYMGKRKGVVRGFDKLRDNFSKMPWWGKIGVSVGLGVLGLKVAGLGAAGLAVNGVIQLGLGALRSTRETSKLASDHSAIIEAARREMVRRSTDTDPAKRFNVETDFGKVAEVQEQFKTERKKSALVGGGKGVATVVALRIAFLLGKKLLGYDVDMGRDLLGMEKAAAAGAAHRVTEVSPQPSQDIAEPGNKVEVDVDGEAPAGVVPSDPGENKDVVHGSAPDTHGSGVPGDTDKTDVLHLREKVEGVLHEPGAGAARRLAQEIVDTHRKANPEAYPTTNHYFAAIRAEKEKLMESGYFDSRDESLIAATAKEMPGNITPGQDMKEVMAELPKYMPDDDKPFAPRTGGVESHHTHRSRVEVDEQEHPVKLASAPEVGDGHALGANEATEAQPSITVESFSEKTKLEFLPATKLDEYLKWLESNHSGSAPVPESYSSGTVISKDALGALMRGEAGQNSKYLSDIVGNMLLRMDNADRTGVNEIRVVADGDNRHLMFPVHSTAPGHPVLRWVNVEINHQSPIEIDKLIHENNQPSWRRAWEFITGRSNAGWYDQRLSELDKSRLETPATAVEEHDLITPPESPQAIEAASALADAQGLKDRADESLLRAREQLDWASSHPDEPAVHEGGAGYIENLRQRVLQAELEAAKSGQILEAAQKRLNLLSNPEPGVQEEMDTEREKHRVGFEQQGETNAESRAERLTHLRKEHEELISQRDRNDRLYYATNGPERLERLEKEMTGLEAEGGSGNVTVTTSDEGEDGAGAIPTPTIADQQPESFVRPSRTWEETTGAATSGQSTPTTPGRVETYDPESAQDQSQSQIVPSASSSSQRVEVSTEDEYIKQRHQFSQAKDGPEIEVPATKQ